MEKRFARISAVLVAVCLMLNSIFTSFSTTVFANNVAETEVLPFTGFTASSVGGTSVTTKHTTKLFTETDVAVVSADREVQGIIAEMPPRDNSMGAVMKISPMTGGIPLTYNSATVTHVYSKTVGLTNEKGLKISTVSGKEYSAPDTTESQAYANIQFDKRNSFVDAQGIMFYLKLDSANTVAPNFGAFKPASKSRWSFDYNPVLMLPVGKEYSYKSISVNSWTKAVSVEDKKGNPNFGAMKFNSAFEGYVKIPFSSLSNDMGFRFNFYQDSLSHMCIKAKNLGGKYGSLTAGPYFIINKDSNSAKMEIDTSVKTAPTRIGAKISGFKEPLKDTDAILVYVKTDSANRITVAANMWDDYLSDVPSLVLKSNAKVYVAALGSSKWTEQKAVKTDAENAIQFSKAFEGYVKIPITSLEEEQASPYISVYPEIDYITGVEVTAAGIGGKFGKLETVSFLINDDRGTAVFKLSDEYKKPVKEPCIVEPILNTETLLYNWEWVKHTEVKPLDYTAAVGTLMEAVAVGGYETERIGESQSYANFKLNNVSLNGYEGLVFYIKLDSANTVMPQVALTIPADKSRWQWSWNPSLMLKVGSTYEYMPISGGDWQSGAAIEGIPGNEYYGSVKFDNAFEGYIKIPFASFHNDSGFTLNKELDTVANIVYRTKGLGDKYGKVTFGPSFFTVKDGACGIKLKEADPIIVKPVNEWTSSPVTYEAEQNAVTPLDWTDAQALKVTKDGEYINDYTANSLVYANFKMNDGYVLGDSTHIIMYVKTGSANTVLPLFSYYGSELGIGYDPAMSLGVGKSYSYLPLNGKKWIDSKTVPTWQSGSGDTNGDGISDTYFGGIKFDSAFEGYIKFAIADFINDYALVNNKDRAKTKIKAMSLVVSRIGGKYGTVTAGPIFLTDNNTDSPIIKIYEEPDANENVPINAAPLNATPSGNGIDYKKILPLTGLTLEGYTLSAKTPWDNKSRFTLKTNTAIKGSDSLLLYIKTSKDTLVVPVFTVGGSEYSLTTGKVSLLDFKTAKWSKNNTVSGGITLKANFEGYVKIPYAILLNDKNSNPDKSKDTLDSIVFGFDTLDKESVTVGAVSLVTNNGGSTEIIYPSSYDSKDPYERIKGILERSKQGLTQGNYYMVGDSTRHINGYPIFRIVRNAFKEYNMNCVVQAQSGLKAQHWSNYTPGLDGPVQPTVDQLIPKIPGTGRNCIVDIALGINDSAHSGNEIYQYLIKGINEIRKAKPEAVIVYTSPTLISFPEQNTNMLFAANKIWADKSIYKIDVMSNVFGGYYSQYYSDTHHPNSLGYKLAAQYIITKYLGGTFKKIFDEDTNSYKLPADATPITSELKVQNSFNIAAGTYIMNVNGKSVTSIKLNGTLNCSGAVPYETSNYIQTELSKPLYGNDYISFYLKMPSANRIGIRAFTTDDNSEIIFKNGVSYFVMPIGGSKWSEKKSTAGRADGVETYGSVDFEGAFEGWIMLPLKGFYGSPSAYEDINGVTFRFSELGGDYGSVCVGAFFAYSDKPYTAKNVWKKSDLPEMEPFSEITALDSAPWVYRDYVASPIPSLSENRGLIIGSDPKADYSTEDFCYSSHWAGTKYNNISLKPYTHLMFYVKVPSAKENHLTTTFFTDKQPVTNLANTDYQLLPLGSNKWQHYVFERTVNQEGGYTIPAGFEGFIKMPISSLISSGAVEDALLNQIIYRFSYIGMDDEAVRVGPVFGVTKDNDPGPEEVIYTSLPAATTIKSLFAIEEGDIFTDKVMVYWEAFEGAKYYMAEAYSINKTEDGYEYKLVSSSRCVTNCGAITDLLPSRKYAILIKAYDLMDKQLAVYDYVTFTTLADNLYVSPTVSDKMTFDKVYYDTKSVSDGNGVGSSVLHYALIGGAVALLAGVAVVFGIVFSRRKKNVK